MTAPRRRPCTAQDALARYRQAVVYLDTAHAVMSEGSLPSDFDYNHVACGVAVLAAIAASDALCCRLLGERPRGQDHREAVTLLATTRSGTGRLRRRRSRRETSARRSRPRSTSRTSRTTA